MEHSPSRGTSRCAPGAFSLTAPVFRSSRAQKGAWCARADLAKPIRYRKRPCGVRKAHNVSRNCTGWRGGKAAGGNRWRERISAGAGVSKRGREQAETGKRKRNQKQVAGRRRGRTDGAGAGRHHFMPYKKSASADRRGRGTLQRKVGKRLERRRGSGTCPVKKGGPAKRPALLTPGSQVEKSIGFPYVGEETR